jgi:NADPH:quinone reductase-like Zn-dependent oxidoreductase
LAVKSEKDIRGSLVLIKKLIEQGKFRAVIDRECSLEQIVEAYKYVGTGQKIGNVVITVEHNNEEQRGTCKSGF